MNILITAGGTSEPIDSVRRITNLSTGELGSKICNELTDRFFKEKTLRDNKIFYICNKEAIKPEESSCIQLIETTNTNSVLEAVTNILENEEIDSVIHSMAISDYTVERVIQTIDLIDKIEENDFSKEEIIALLTNPPSLDNESKISSKNEILDIRLKKTPKVIDIIKKLAPNTQLIGFKLLNQVSEDELIEVAVNSLKRTFADYIVANDLEHIKKGEHKAFIVKEDGLKEEAFIGKENIAKAIIDLLPFKEEPIEDQKHNN